MQLSYDGEYGHIELILNDTDIIKLEKQKNITQSGLFVCIDKKHEIAEPVWDRISPTKILGLHISNELFQNFLDAKPNQTTKEPTYMVRL
jgi:hypothetical protein